jgi:calcineurin-like phosphoesterase family protein
MRISPDTFVISDFHFGHKNIAAYQQREPDHEEAIVRAWNQAVGDTDLVLYLGDLALTTRERTKLYTDRLKGQKLLVLGNHDRHPESFYRECGFEVVDPIYRMFLDGSARYPIIFTHEPIEELPAGWYNVHGHIHRGHHRDYDLTERHFNVSCEPLDYTPVQIRDILMVFGRNAPT